MIAGGTMILLEDGEAVAVESISSHHIVRTRDGTNEAVLACALVADFHVLQLRTEDGHLLICNDEQLIAFPGGYMPAATVSAGQEVFVADGVATVSSLEQNPDIHPVYQLETAGSGEYIANGIVCSGGKASPPELTGNSNTRRSSSEGR